MDPTSIELMLDQVRAIYRALTGNDMPEPPPPQAGAGSTTSPGDVLRQFADLEAIARGIPAVIERVPPFSFSPPLDAIDDTHELLIEVAVPGVVQSDVTVERTDGMLVVRGFRRGERVANGRAYFHAEIPRGPFHRVVRLPYRMLGEPRVTVENGLVQIHLPKSPAGAPAKA